MEIILIRHGESIGNKNNIVQGHDDYGLSELGLIQAHKLAEYFNNDNIDAIYSSDLDRAMQTAAPTAKKTGIKIQTNSDLREAHFGIWEGMTFNQVKETYPKEHSTWHKNYLIRPKWFESFESHLNRTKKAIEKILKSQNYNDRVLVFTHGGTIKTQIGYFNKLSGEELADFRTYNCSLTCIKFNPTTLYEKGKLIYYNKIVID